MTLFKHLLPAILLAAANTVTGQVPAGKLFIIGGGDRPPILLQSLLQEASLTAGDYIVVLPMSSAEPDTAYHYFKTDMETVCRNPVLNFNFIKGKAVRPGQLDSLIKAKLIFITGGDQDRFMKAVLQTPVFDAIHKAYQQGATIGGTSAGAAVMSRYMITGNQLLDTFYRSTFPLLMDKNIEISEGMGLLTKAVIDQHFIARSRYNRLFSALARFPALACIGIDEATAIIVQGKKVKVSGVSQVVVASHPEGLTVTPDGLIKWKDVRLSIYSNGDSFVLPD